MHFNDREFKEDIFVLVLHLINAEKGEMRRATSETLLVV